MYNTSTSIQAFVENENAFLLEKTVVKKPFRLEKGSDCVR